MAIPQGWTNLGPNTPTIYKASFSLKGNNPQSGAPLVSAPKIIVETNTADGNFNVYQDRGIAGQSLVYVYNASNNTNYVANNYLYKTYFTGNAASQLTNLQQSVKSSTLAIVKIT